MKRARWVSIVLAVVFIIGVITVCWRTYDTNGSNPEKADTEDAYYAAEETLLKCFGADKDKNDISNDSEEGKIEDMASGSRLTQRVTVKDEDEMLPYSGTIIKNQDALYPDTYEISFTNNELLPEQATVEVEMDVLKGDEVYVLTGDKELGYTEYAVVTVDEYNKVSFTTDTLQKYTLSTTNIPAAQEAMAGIKGN